ESRLLDDAPGSANVGIHEKEGLIPVFDMGDTISSRREFIESNAREHGKGQGFPFIAGRPSRQTKGRETIEIVADSPIKRGNQSMPFAVYEWDTTGGDGKRTAHEIIAFFIHIRMPEDSTAPLGPSCALSIEEIAANGIAAMR